MTGQAIRQDTELRIDTPQHTWCFDSIRRRFRRIPLGRDPHDPAVVSDWAPYSSVKHGPDGALTVLLDAAGTLRLRVVT